MDKSPSTQELSAPADWLTQHGDALYRYAYLRLHDAAQAEDLVQETLLAALQARHEFKGRSTERTWLLGILKHKLVDVLRKSAREQPIGALAETDEEIEALFDAAGRWRTPPSDWGSPAGALERKEFWKIFAECFAALPSRQAQVFAMCEFDGLDSADVCKAFGISVTNVWVMLYRARQGLRQCLGIYWFGRAAKE